MASFLPLLPLFSAATACASVAASFPLRGLLCGLCGDVFTRFRLDWHRIVQFWLLASVPTTICPDDYLST